MANNRARRTCLIPGRGTAVICLVFTALVVLTASCGSSHVVATNATKNPAPDLTGMAQDLSQLNNPSKMKLPPVQLNRIQSTASHYQQGLVKDGSLTLDEYEKAELAYAACMQSAGYRLHPGSATLNGLARIDVVVGQFSNFRAEQKDEARCKGMYTSSVDMVWASLTQAIEQRVESEAGKSFDQCLADAGLKPGPGWTRTGPSDPAQHVRFNGCRTTTAAKYKIGESFVPVPSPGGNGS